MQTAVPAGTSADQLFINGQRQIMARYPNFDPKAAQFNGTADDAFSASRAARWADPAGGFMHAMHPALWGDMHYLITGKDDKGNLTYVGGWQNNRKAPPHRQFRFVENIFEDGGLKNREGYNRIVENNIVLGAREGSFHPHVWYSNSRDVFRNNIVSTAYKPIGMPRGPWGEFVDNNILQSPGQAPPMPATALQRASGRDEHTIVADVLFVDPARGDYRVKDNSPALTLGFKNFPMDQFGVTDPKLHVLARTPFTTGMIPSPLTQPNTRDPATRDFLGAKVKNVIGMGEISASGLSGEAGVILMQVPAGSAAGKAGLKQSDVILKCQDQEIRGMEELFKAFAGAAKGTKLTLGVWRLQQNVSASITVK